MGRPDFSLSLITRITPWNRSLPVPKTIGQLLGDHKSRDAAKKAAIVAATAANKDVTDRTDDSTTATAAFVRGLVKVGPIYEDNGDGTQTEYFPSADGKSFSTELLHNLDTPVPDEPEDTPANA